MFVPHTVIHNAEKKRAAYDPTAAMKVRTAGIAMVAAGLAGVAQVLTRGHIRVGSSIALAVVLVVIVAGSGFLLARVIGRRGRI